MKNWISYRQDHGNPREFSIALLGEREGITQAQIRKAKIHIGSVALEFLKQQFSHTVALQKLGDFAHDHLPREGQDHLHRMIDESVQNDGEDVLWLTGLVLNLKDQERIHLMHQITFQRPGS